MVAADARPVFAASASIEIREGADEGGGAFLVKAVWVRASAASASSPPTKAVGETAPESVGRLVRLVCGGSPAGVCEVLGGGVMGVV